MVTPRVSIKVNLDSMAYLRLVERARREGRTLSGLAAWILSEALGNCQPSREATDQAVRVGAQQDNSQRQLERKPEERSAPSLPKPATKEDRLATARKLVAGITGMTSVDEAGTPTEPVLVREP